MVSPRVALTLMKRKITVVGTGYVGMSLAVLLARSNDVVAFDIDPSRVEAINFSRIRAVKPTGTVDFIMIAALKLNLAMSEITSSTEVVSK